MPFFPEKEGQNIFEDFYNYLLDFELEKYKFPWEKYENPEKIVISDGITSISAFAFMYGPRPVDGVGVEPITHFNKTKEVSIPNNVTKIGAAAFKDCSELSSIKLPNGLTDIGGYCFEGCSNIKEIKFPNALTKLPEFICNECTSLTEISLGDKITEISKSAFYMCNLQQLELPDSVEYIGENAFANDKSIKNLSLPKSLKKIDDGAFGNCTGLENVTFGDNIKEIGKEAFEDCYKIKSVTLPKSIEVIGEHALGYGVNYCYDHVTIDDFEIRGYKNTVAEKYAKENNIKFVALD